MITDELLFRYLNQETSKKEDILINKWLSKNPDQVCRLDLLREISEPTDTSLSREETVRNWEAIESQLHDNRSKMIIRRAFPIQFARIAAIVLLLIGSGLLWYSSSNNHVLRNKELITKSISLPDGTQVDLGPGSKLVYGRKYSEGTRIVRLTGEAFFDVTSDPDHPFTVIAGLAKIKVTGTRFVVNASPVSKEVEVSVKSGKVLFYNSDTMNKNSFRMGLVAGEKGIFYPAMNRMDKTIDPHFHTTP